MEKNDQLTAPVQEESKTSTMQRVYMIFVIGLVFHSITGVLVKVSNFEPITSAFLRCIIALVAIIPFAYFEMKKKRKLNKQGIWLALIGGIFLGLDFIFFNYSIFYVGSGIAMVLLNIQVIMLPALTLIFDGERPGKIYYILIPFMIMGLILTGGIFDSTSAVSGGPDKIFGWDLALLGTILGAASGTCYGFYLYFTRKAGLTNPGLDVQTMVWAIAAQLVPQVIAAFMDISGRGGFDFTHGLLQNGAVPLLNPETALGDNITTMSWVYMVILGICGQAICWTFIQYGQVRMSSTNAAAMLLLSPVASLFVGFVWVHEVPSGLQIFGVIIVLLAVAVQNGLHKPLFKKSSKQKT